MVFCSSSSLILCTDVFEMLPLVAYLCLPNITLLTLIATLYLQGEPPTYILDEDTRPVIRAIGVSHTACKDEFRRNPRSHSWSLFSIFIIYFVRFPINGVFFILNFSVPMFPSPPPPAFCQPQQQDTTFDFEKRRNRPVKYDREAMGKTLLAMKKVRLSCYPFIPLLGGTPTTVGIQHRSSRATAGGGGGTPRVHCRVRCQLARTALCLACK